MSGDREKLERARWLPMSAFFAADQDGPYVRLKVGDRETLGFYDEDESCWRDQCAIGESDDGRPWEQVDRESRIEPDAWRPAD